MITQWKFQSMNSRRQFERVDPSHRSRSVLVHSLSFPALILSPCSPLCTLPIRPCRRCIFFLKMPPVLLSQLCGASVTSQPTHTPPPPRPVHRGAAAAGGGGTAAAESRPAAAGVHTRPVIASCRQPGTLPQLATVRGWTGVSTRSVVPRKAAG